MGGLRITVEAGSHRRPACLLEIPAPTGSPLGLQVWQGNQPVKAQFEPAPHGEGGTLLLLAPAMEAGATVVFSARPGVSDGVADAAVLEEPDGVSVLLGGKRFTTYHYGVKIARPYFYPLIASSGASVTRSWPMDPGPPDEDRDHPHHRGLWVAHGDVNGFDNWHAGARTRHDRFSRIASGAVVGRMDACGTWLNDASEFLLKERREVQFFELPLGIRIVDIELELSAGADPVRFGDTKEGGLCSVRVATSMTGTRGGRIETSAGKVGESEAWGSRAGWCDYSGTVDGTPVGVAILDHPDNFRHPTYWHVRNYGLMTANPFGVAAFTGDPTQDGAHTLEPNDSLRFRYRVLVHTGDARAAEIAGHYYNWTDPPQVVVSDGD